ncbi:ComF family protein [Geminicoccus roseus]|uniref:ComF family protein n=1 Tax=Geminicoccus roseus TaxID=404900 RepID=UPI0003F74985|nr:ComF family protein [Geminicoccus roseus]
MTLLKLGIVSLLGRSLLDAILPPRCPSCGETVGEQGTLCPACWAKLRFIAEPACERCAVPILQAPPGIVVCPACVISPPAYDRARAALRYDSASAPMILAMKHRAKLQAVQAFGAWMTRAAADYRSADGLVPVPLHRWRMLHRGFNQSCLLARMVGRTIGLPVLDQVLVRVRATPSQQGLGGVERARNMGRGVFDVPERRRSLVQGRKLVLVDDVLTTGSTLSACAEALRRAGATNVDVLVLARVVRGDPMTISSID